MAALIKYKKENVLNRAVLTTVPARQKFCNRAKAFTVSEEGGLCLTGKKVPTIEEVDEILKATHISESGRHLRDLKFLRKILAQQQYALPKYCGGLTNAIIE